MPVVHPTPQVPVYALEPDHVAKNKHFRMYNLQCALPHKSDLLVPHRKDHYLIVLVRQGGNRQWVDMKPYILQDNTVYFTGPGHIIVKEGHNRYWSTGIAFTREFLSFQENSLLSNLPILQNPAGIHELKLTAADVAFIEEIIVRLNAEYEQPGEWQQRMLGAHLAVLLTYLSRLYTAQAAVEPATADRSLLRGFQAKIDECYRELHEVGDYASLLNISAGHLSEVVKIQSGKPAIKHIHERLVLEARRLLFHTESPLKEIAFNLGFSDASYFNRFFKRETGETPAEYRSNIREMYH